MAMVFIARWFPHPERRDEFIGVVMGLKDALPPDVAAALGVMVPATTRDGDVVFIEKWESEAMCNKLRASPLFHEAIRNMSACCRKPLQIEHLNSLGEDGSVFSRYPVGKADPKYYPDLGTMTALYR